MQTSTPMNKHDFDYRRRLIRHNRAMETGEPSVRETSEFDDSDLLYEAWRMSPYNKQKSRSTTKEEIREEIVQQAMCFQPVSGYCGLATVNTVLRSLSTPCFVSYPDRGRGYSMFSLAEYLILNCAPIPFINVEAVFMEGNTTLEEFRMLLKKYANSSQHRLLANFHRTPLFYSERSTEDEAYRRAYAGHWSPIGGYISTPKGEFVLVLDTNSQYGPFMVSLERFFSAVKTETLQDGYRGILRVEV